ncbi:hypothetical protein CVT25_005958, partial [Psilocybe cyanescens]
VYVNSKKFACESCIKGHRSSSCHHTDRPLFEIKKKGRPVSQCTKCRELRQSKKFHSKCNCNPEKSDAPAVQPLSSTSISKTRRFIPIVPALPNGLRDVLESSQASSSIPPDSRQRVDSLLNPCNCKSVWKCQCKNSTASGSSGPSSTDALTTLARAAAMRCCSPLPNETADDRNALGAREKMRRSRPTSPSQSSNKRHKDDKTYATSPGPDLAPIYFSPTISAPLPRGSAMPEFPSMPPMSEISSLAGSGCTCGVRCSCPGCVEHRGPLHANHDWKDCHDGCGTCVDPSVDANLPSTSQLPNNPGGSILDRFFARAAALPPPPVNRKMWSHNIDPMDTTLYKDSTRLQGSQSFGFGVVNLPKLECCGGQCNCPDGRCSCRVSCAGCCADAKEDTQSAQITMPVTTTENTVPSQRALRSCCAGKV